MSNTPGHGESQAEAGAYQGGSHILSDNGRMLATVDSLGQTLIATVVVSAVSGHDAVDLTGNIALRMRESGARHVVLDLQNVEHIDSTCLGVLVELLTKLHEAGGRIALVNAARNVEFLFKLTRLDRVFPICRDMIRALDVVERSG